MTVALEAYGDLEWLEAERFLSKQVNVKPAVVEIKSERDCLPFPEAGVCFEAIDELFE